MNVKLFQLTSFCVILWFRCALLLTNQINIHWLMYNTSEKPYSSVNFVALGVSLLISLLNGVPSQVLIII